METVLCLVLLLSCYAGPTLCAHEATGGGESEAASIPVAPPCAMSHERLYKVLKELVIEGLELYINCLSFDRNAALVSGVISGVNQSNSTTGERLDLECVEGIIAGRPTLLPPSMEIMNTTACLNCSDETTNICRGECQSPCERCFETSTTCSRCIACMAEPNKCTLQKKAEGSLNQYCQPNCTVTLEVEPERFNACDCPSGYHKELSNPQEAPEKAPEEEGEVRCDFSPDLKDFRCVKNCTSGLDPHDSLGICFACGIEYCLKCDRPSNQCQACLENTQLYEHECFACPLATVAREAIVQEEELEEEEREGKLRQIELAVSLPILCVLVVLFFLGMSIFAHFRYPHINPKGHKRHRVKPDEFTLSTDLPPDSDFDTTPSAVWRARPTVRLR